MRGTCRCAVSVKSEKFLEGGLCRWFGGAEVLIGSSSSGFGNTVDNSVSLSRMPSQGREMSVKGHILKHADDD